MATRHSSRKKSSGVSLEVVAKWVFLVGLLLSVIIGALVATGAPQAGLEIVVIVWMLMALASGFLFVRKENELHFFLVAIILFTFNASLSSLPYSVGQYLGSVLNAVSFYVGIASLSVAIRNIVGWYLPD